MLTFKIILFLLGMLLIAATLLSLLPWSYWWVRDLDFPRVQLVFFMLIVFFLYPFLINSLNIADIAFLAVLLACTAYQLYCIYPYTPVASKQVKQSAARNERNQLALLVANVLMENRNTDGLYKLIEEVNPDLILLVEIDHWWTYGLKTLADNYPHSLVYPLDNTYGMALYSRFELTDARVNFLIQDDVPSIYVHFRLPSGVQAGLYGVHPRPPSPTEHYRSTERDAELLIVAEKIKNTSRPVLVAGDLNDVAWSRTNALFQRISGLLDPRIGRGTFGTFPAAYPYLRWPLDHIFHSDHFRLVDMRTLPEFGSDHLPVFIRLSYEPATADGQEEPEAADREDRRDAHETIREAKESN